MGSTVLLGFIIIKTIASFEVKGKKAFNKKTYYTQIYYNHEVKNSIRNGKPTGFTLSF